MYEVRMNNTCWSISPAKVEYVVEVLDRFGVRSEESNSKDSTKNTVRGEKEA